MSESAIKFLPYRVKVGSTAECIKRLSFGSASPHNLSSMSVKSEMLAPSSVPMGGASEIVPTSKVQVCLRIKPTQAKPETLAVLDESKIRATPPPGVAPTFKITEYSFSRVFGPQATQHEVFEHVAGGLVSQLLDQGKDGLIFAYGVTNSGKTFTVEGNSDNPGIIPQTLKRIFAVPPTSPVYVSYLQVYNDQVHDLQEPPQVPSATDPLGQTRKNLKVKLREDCVLVEGLKETRIHDLKEGMAILEKGRENRNTNDNSINHASSRSHTVFILRVGQAKLHIVDLAGSERGKRTKATGARQVEASNINLSLSQLMQCLEAMRANQKLAKLYPDKPRDKPPFRPIPFRDCKLTMLFRDCLRGRNCAGVVMVVNASPDPLDFEETCQALRYGEMTRSTAIEPNQAASHLLNMAAAVTSRYDYNGRLIRTQVEPSSVSELPQAPSLNVSSRQMNPDDPSRISVVSHVTQKEQPSLVAQRVAEIEARSARKLSPPNARVVIPTVLPPSLFRSAMKPSFSIPSAAAVGAVASPMLQVIGSSKQQQQEFPVHPPPAAATPVDLLEENCGLRKELHHLKNTLLQQEMALREELSSEMAQALAAMQERYEKRLENMQNKGHELLHSTVKQKTELQGHNPHLQDLKILADQLDECEAEMDRMREQHKRDLDALQTELNHARRANIEASLQQRNAHQEIKQMPSTPWMVAEERRKVDRYLRQLEEEKKALAAAIQQRLDLQMAVDRLVVENKVLQDREASLKLELSNVKEQLEVAKQTIISQDKQIYQFRAKIASPQQCAAQLSGNAPNLLLSKRKLLKENDSNNILRSRENNPLYGNVS